MTLSLLLFFSLLIIIGIIYMSLCPKKIIVLRRDDDSSGKNIVPSAEVSIKNMAGDLVSIYSDSNGTVSIGNPTDVTANGELEFWIEEGRYYAESAGSEPFYFDVVAPFVNRLIIKGEQSFDLTPEYNNGHIRCEYEGAKTITIPWETYTPQPENAYYEITNRQSGDLTIVPGVGIAANVSTNPYGEDSFIVKNGETISIRRINTNFFDVTFIDKQQASPSEPVVTKSTSTFNLDSSEIDSHIRCTFNGAKTMTIRPESTHPQPDDAKYKITNRSNGDLSVTLGSGVTAVRAGSGSQYSTITVKYGSTLFLKRVAADTYDVEITSDNYGVGTNTSSLGGVSADYSDILGCGFYSVPSGYNTGLGTLPSACPKIRIDQSSNLSAEILFVLPSGAGLNDGKVLGRDRTGAGWNGHFEYMTSRNTAAVNLNPVYDEFVSTNGGVTVRLRIWSGENSRDAHALVDVAGTATNGTAGSALPSLSTSFLGSKIYPYIGNILIPFFTTSGGNTVASGYLTINTSGTVAYSVINGTAYGSPASVYQTRYLTT